ncbi:hypothetical protein AVEN_100365-1 [Araneus ventricosus]|uniref:Uncharacterized protein n=1 Tax=Araneus ventricosus TaxID=182803 RepID=A0A4Y2JFW9_ARAVE|nr:hypothetical protein AVEN_100365-1 [Araneus ventricosus]
MTALASQRQPPPPIFNIIYPVLITNSEPTSNETNACPRRLVQYPSTCRMDVPKPHGGLGQELKRFQRSFCLSDGILIVLQQSYMLILPPVLRGVQLIHTRECFINIKCSSWINSAYLIKSSDLPRTVEKALGSFPVED